MLLDTQQELEALDEKAYRERETMKEDLGGRLDAIEA